MEIKKEKMVLKLEEDVDKLKKEIEELIKLKGILKNSSPYKLLYGKTQVIGENKSKSVRSRLEHSEQISNIAQRIIEGIYDSCATTKQKEKEIFILNKQRELLYTDICSLAHDLGHTPFGHSGEKTISEFMEKITDEEQIKKLIQKRIECFGLEYEEEQGHIGDNVTLSFEHNEQSALTFYQLLKTADINLDLINVKKMIDAILSHSTTRVLDCPKDIVAQAIRQTDKIEYRNRDFEELKPYIKLSRIENTEYANMSYNDRIERIIQDVIKEAISIGRIGDNMEALEALSSFRKEYDNTIYFLEGGEKGLLTSENIGRNRVILQKLLQYYYEDPARIKYTKSYYSVEPINIEANVDLHVVHNTLEDKDSTNIEKVINYILSMDNERVMKKYLQLVKQRIVTGEGIEPVLPEEIEEINKKQEEEKIEQMRSKELLKSTQPHTKEETRNIIRNRDIKFVNTMLTKRGIEVINATKQRIEKEAQMDRALRKQMEIGDLARKYGDNNMTKSTKEVDKIMKNPTQKEIQIKKAEGMQRKVEELKQNWIPVEPHNMPGDEDGQEI